MEIAGWTFELDSVEHTFRRGLPYPTFEDFGPLFSGRMREDLDRPERQFRRQA